MTTSSTVPATAGPRSEPVTPSGRRAPLDGLRAVAVTAVVIYHFGGGGSSVLRGGFLGVDLFFVLSGYLITGILLAEHARTGRIALGGFWARRIRRLLPAMVLLSLAVGAVTWWSAMPETWPARRGDLLWTTSYLANWHFVSVGEDYFAAYSGASPLRHMWSLSIEEQFYAAWPLAVLGVLTLGRRLGRRVLAGLAAVLVLASAVAMVVSFEAGSVARAYYGTDGRVQQLLVGAGLALLMARMTTAPRTAGPSGLEAAASPGGPHALLVARFARSPLAGVAAGPAVVLVLTAFVLMADDAPLYYRGGALGFALVAAGVIAAVELAPTGRLGTALSWAPAVALGRISYGVYLWHWPVALWLPVHGDTGTLGWWQGQAVRVAVTLGAATTSYVLVEKPIIEGRLPRVGRSVPRTIVAAVVAAALVVAASLAFTHLPGSLSAQLDDRADTPCPGETTTHLVTCVQHQGGAAAPVTLVLGDSTARALVPGLQEQAALRGTTLVQAAWQRCTPTGLLVLPEQDTADGPAQTCTAQARGLITQALATYHPDRVLVTEFWTHHHPLLVDGRILRPGTPAHAEALRSAYQDLTDEIGRSGAQVVFIELPPPGLSVGPIVAAGRPAGDAVPSPGGAFVAPFNAVLADVARRDSAFAATIDITDLLCGPDGTCPALLGDQLVRMDGVHVTAAWSRVIAPQLLARVDDVTSALDPATRVGS